MACLTGFHLADKGGKGKEEAKSDVLEVGAVVFTAGDLKGVYVKNKLKVVKVFRERKGGRKQGCEHKEQRRVRAVDAIWRNAALQIVLRGKTAAQSLNRAGKC